MVGRYGASVGKVFWGKDGAYNVVLVKMIDRHGAFANRFMFKLLRSPHGQSYFSGISRSAQDGFNKNDIKLSPLLILPLAEQHRIVARVDELMALCDQLANRLKAARERSGQYAIAATRSALEAA
jgi:type I restriction enzyme S subunit